MKTLANLVTVLAATAALAMAPLVSSADAPPAYPTAEQTIHGRITAVNDLFHISVRDDHGGTDTVELHHGTIINPTGLTLAAGMSVTVLGYNAGSVFEANEIDTPYTVVTPPAPMYYGPGWWYPGFPYGYGPSFVLRIGGGGELRRGPFERHPWHGNQPEPRPYAGHLYEGGHR